MKIKVNLANINGAIKAIEDFRDNFEKRQREFLMKLAEIGVAVAEARFKSAVYDGTNDVEVEKPVWIRDNCIAVRASGQAVTFIEFGAGVHYGEQHEKAADLGFTRGGYGKGQGKHDFWFYKGEPGTNGKQSTTVPGLIYTHGNPPNRCMWEADKSIKAKLLEIAKEVFGND